MNIDAAPREREQRLENVGLAQIGRQPVYLRKQAGLRNGRMVEKRQRGLRPLPEPAWMRGPRARDLVAKIEREQRRDPCQIVADQPVVDPLDAHFAMSGVAPVQLRSAAYEPARVGSLDAEERVRRYEIAGSLLQFRFDVEENDRVRIARSDDRPPQQIEVRSALQSGKPRRPSVPGQSLLQFDGPRVALENLEGIE